MAANSNVGSTNSGSSRRTSSSGGRAGSVASSLSKTLSAGSNAEVNSSETSSGSFSCMTTTTSSGGSEGAVAAPMETVGSGGGLRRAASAGGKTKKRFVGVRQRPSGRWVAEIKDTTQKIRLWLGTFDTAEDAARAYDEAAWLLRGANTRTNFVPSTSTDASVLPSKAARLLQLRRNAAAANGAASCQENSGTTATAAPAPVNSKPSQTQGGTSAGNKPEGNVEANSINSSPLKSGPPSPSPVVLTSAESNSNSDSSHRSIGSRATPSTLVSTASAASTSPFSSGNSNIGNVSNFSGEVSKSGSSYENPVEEMCGIEEAPSLNNHGPELFQPDLRDSQRRNDHATTVLNVKQELVSNTYQPRLEPSPIRENRKEKDYCSEPPRQESFVDDTDMSSGLSGLDDVDLSCVDSVYSSPFDFSADMGPGLDLGNLISSPLSTELGANGEEDSLTEHWRRMSYERQISAGLYAINGVHECLSLSSHSFGQSSSWNGGLSSPSLSGTAGFRRSTSGPFLTGSPAGWKTIAGSGTSGNNGSGSWGTVSQQQQANSSGPSSVGGNNGTNNSTVAENADCPSQDALWQSWDLPPLCVVA